MILSVVQDLMPIRHLPNPPSKQLLQLHFLKLIGKMCKKDKSSKYFMNHKKEDNRMVIHKDGERMISEEERVLFENRYNVFKEFVLTNRHLF